MDVPDDLVHIFEQLDPPLRKRKLSTSIALKNMCFVLRTGLPWRHLSICGISSSAVYKRFQVWLAKGVFTKAWTQLITMYVAPPGQCAFGAN